MSRRRTLALCAAVLTVVACFGFEQAVSASRTEPTPVSFASNPSGKGYWVAYANGRVRGFGNARPMGGADKYSLRRPIVGIAATSTGRGYWLVASDGGIFTFGDARFRGSLGNLRLAQPIVGMASTPRSRGYWLVAADGGVFAFGDARFRGSTGALRLQSPIVGMASTPKGRGYWLVGEDGGVFSFGDARFHGSMASRGDHAPVTGITASRDGRAYWMTTRDAHVYGFGNISYAGSASVGTHRPIVGLAGHGGAWQVLGADGRPVRYREWGSRQTSTTPPPVKSTEPPATDPPATDPPTTEPPTTEPPSTVPSTTTPTTGPPSTTPPSTTPPTTTPPPPPDHQLPAPRFISNNIGDYVRQPGNQIIVVPNGRYHGSGAGALTPPARNTSGSLDGWLVLVAQSKGGAVVDLAGAELNFGAGDWRVLFVGFTFENGTIYPHGQHLAFWYSDMSFANNVWEKQTYYRHARPFDASDGGAQDVSLVGVDLHDASTLIRAGHTSNLLVDGTRLYGSSATSLGHNDAISCRGGCTNVTITNSDIHGRVIFTDGETRESPQNKVSGLTLRNSWFSDSPSAGVFFGALTTNASGSSSHRGVFGAMTDAYVWDQNGSGRMEQILQDDNSTLKSYYTTSKNQQPGRVNVTETNVHYSAPPAGAPNPALRWREQHPYGSFWDYFSFLQG